MLPQLLLCGSDSILTFSDVGFANPAAMWVVSHVTLAHFFLAFGAFDATKRMASAGVSR